MAQQEIDFGKTWLVGTRVEGSIQHFHVDATTHREARHIVGKNVEGAHPVLAVIPNGIRNKEKINGNIT